MPKVTGCGHMRSATSHKSYMRDVHLKRKQRKLKYTEKAGAAASRLLNRNQYVKQYYSECYNRDV